MNADELRALRDDCKRRADVAWTDQHANWMLNIADALDQAASDRAALERVRDRLRRWVRDEDDEDLWFAIYASLRDEQKGLNA
jgi:hypothetical protein